MPIAGAAIGAIGAIGGAAIASSGANKAAKTQANAAKNASDAQLQATNNQIAATQQAANQGVAYIQPTIDRTDAAGNLISGALGTGGANQQQWAQQYQTGFNNSPYYQDMQAASQAGVNALASQYAARGMGGVTSGQAQEGAMDWVKRNRSTATNSYMNALGAQADQNYNARIAAANTKIGAGSQVASAWGNYGANQANLLMTAGNNAAQFQAQNAANLGGLFSYGANALGSNWNSISKSMPNVFGGGSTASSFTPAKVDYSVGWHG